MTMANDGDDKSIQRCCLPVQWLLPDAVGTVRVAGSGYRVIDSLGSAA